jgi:thiamine-monophosphate kinase
VPPARPTNTGSGDRVLNETELIQTYLAPLATSVAGAFGLRDDAALLTPEPGTDFVLSSDPIIAGVHFLPSDRPADIAWKALAVNASDLAAKGAQPVAYLMNLAFHEAPEHSWMSEFAGGLKSAQERFGCRLIGGDTDVTPGPLSIAITIIGAVPSGQFVRRQGAARGDHVFVTGTIGDSALGLRVHRDENALPALAPSERKYLEQRYLRPEPRLALASALRAHASAALDISDGFLKDLSRLACGRGLTVEVGSVPLSSAARSAIASMPGLVEIVLTGGDDYELLVAVPAASVEGFIASTAAANMQVTDIGILEENGDVRMVDGSGNALELPGFGYDHFSR